MRDICSIMDERISEIRRFNRAFARWLGLFDEFYTATQWSPAEGRLFYELDAAGHTSGAELARAMNVDPAYLSRMLKKFVAEGMVAISPSLGDRRRNQLALTSDGDRIAAHLNASSDAAIEKLIQPLSETERGELVSAMQTILRLLEDDEAGSAIVLRPHRIGDIAHIVARQAQLYADEFGWDGTYEGLAAEIGGKFLQTYDPTTEACWIAERAGRIIGSIFVVDAGNGVAQLRLLYVEGSARGLGVGGMLVDQVIAFARDRGYRKVRLWTQAELVSARRVYARAGFKLVESKPHHSFGKDLVGEYWELPLV